MKSQFRHVGLIGKYTAPATPLAQESSRRLLMHIAGFLEKLGCTVWLEQQTALGLDLGGHPRLSAARMGAQCDLALVVGGDGTMLGIGRQLAPFDVPLIGINQGRLGFITDIALEDFQQVLGPMLAGDYEQDERSLLHGRVWRGQTCIYDALAMNDIVVNRGASSGMVELRVEVGGHFVANQRADGLIVATSTGSTAYALSAGGPLLHPSVGGWVLVPIAPHTLSNRPLVLPDTSHISMELVAARDATATFDMNIFPSLQHGDRITVERSDFKVRFLHPRGWSYFDTLRKKLHWNEGGA